MDGGYKRIVRHTLTHEWKISNVRSRVLSSQTLEKDIDIYSPSFSTSSKIKTYWKLKLTFNGTNSEHKDWISLQLQSLKFNNAKVKTIFSFFIQDNHKRKLKTERLISKVFKDLRDGYGLLNFCMKHDILKNDNDIVFNDSITVGVQLIVFDEEQVESSDHVTGDCFGSDDDNDRDEDDDSDSSSNAPPLKKLKHSINHDYKELFNSKIGSDVVLTVQNNQYKAHKLILSVRSPVFKTMFSSISRSKKIIPIQDIEPEIFESILEFIYTDKVPDVITEDLLKAAHKFQLELLKEVCEKFFCKSITTKTAVSMFMLAEKYNSNPMLDYIAEFIVKNAKSIRATPEYNAIKKSNPSLMSLLFEKSLDLKFE